MQLVLVVPSTPTINVGIEPTQLTFAPTNGAQLHQSKRLPRVIVPVFPRTSSNEMSRSIDALKSGARLKAMRQLLGNWSSLAKREVKLAGFLRWVRVSQIL